MTTYIMLTIIVYIISLLLLATLIVEYQLIANHTVEARKNRLRIRTWWVICGICLPVLYIGGWAITVLVYCLVYWAAFEFSRLLNLRINVTLVLIFTFFLVSYHVLIRALPDFLSLFFIIPFLTFFVLLIVSKLRLRIAAFRNLLVLMLCITSIFSIILVGQQSDKLGYDAGLVIVFLFLITAINDIAQYVFGKKFGQRPLAKKLSKHKTCEGALGGVLLTSGLSGIVMPYIFDVNGLTAALIGGVIALFGIVGDLNVSYLKRHAKVKDSGISLPGHGGLLDRIDSLILAAPGFGFFLTLT